MKCKKLLAPKHSLVGKEENSKRNQKEKAYYLQGNKIQIDSQSHLMKERNGYWSAKNSIHSVKKIIIMTFKNEGKIQTFSDKN